MHSWFNKILILHLFEDENQCVCWCSGIDVFIWNFMSRTNIQGTYKFEHSNLSINKTENMSSLRSNLSALVCFILHSHLPLEQLANIFMFFSLFFLLLGFGSCVFLHFSGSLCGCRCLAASCFTGSLCSNRWHHSTRLQSSSPLCTALPQCCSWAPMWTASVNLY